MTDTPIVPVILSGGSGTRLWPMSTPERPKQFLPLTAEETMLQLTARRTAGARFGRPIVVAGARHADEIAAQLASIGLDALLVLEPLARNTGPAIALAALAVDAPETPILIMPSDHVIGDVEAFHAAIAAALPMVEDGWLVTFGITPDAPETGYGYIRIGEALAPQVHRVDRFVEKPERAVAEAMVASGDYAWNGGIFLFRADAFLHALAVHAPAMLDAARHAMARGERDAHRILPEAQAFAASPSESIDYAVMEKAERVAVVPVAMGWSDVGSWDALHTVSALDADGNATRGTVTVLDSRNCLVHTDRAHIAMVGVDDLIVVASGDDILILPRGRSQEVKRLLEAMKR